MVFGARLRASRERLGLSQEQVADALGVTKASISAWESGRKLPEAARLPDISRHLGRSIDHLFGAVDEDRGTYYVGEPISAVSSRERDVIEWLRAIPAPARGHIEAVILALADPRRGS